jgi:hypothetical protein
LSVSGSEIVVRTVPIEIQSCANATGGTSVTNIESGDTATSSVQFTYILPRPSISNISPFVGPQTGNTLVVVSGSNFGIPMVVDFLVGGSSFAGFVQASTETSINVRTPAIPDSVLSTEPCDVNGTPPTGVRYIPTLADVKVTDPATNCSTTLPGVFTFTPTDGSCRND